MAKKVQHGFDFSSFLKKLKAEKTEDTRKEDTIEERQYFLIVCEGERTEPMYFEAFKEFLPRKILDTIEIHGEGVNTIDVVNRAIELAGERQQSLSPNYDQVWAVFDRDSFSAERVNQACDLAQRSNVSLGFTNEAFELWYLLHFQYLNTGVTRHQYIEILNRIFQKTDGSRYLKNRSDIYDFLATHGNQEMAISHAQKLYSMFISDQPADSKPSTSVHLLVMELNRYLKI